MKKIAVFTSGGDAPGMNAAIRAVVRCGLQNNLEVVGIQNGYEGMIDGNFITLTSRSVGNIIHRGGTILKTSRSERFLTEAGRKTAFDQLRLHQIDGIIAIGGDGTFKGATVFTEEYDIPFIGLPGTIDNDLAGTEYTIGYDTAINTAMQSMDKIRDTATSHGRLFFIEVMGRDSGAIALDSGIASGAEDIFIPEIKTDLEEFSAKLQLSKHKESYMIVVSEGDELGHVKDIAEKFQKMHPEYEIKFVVLGHLLRGGNPTAIDRIIPSKMGIAAVEALLNNERNVMIGWKENNLHKTALSHAIKRQMEINKPLLAVLNALSY